MPARVLTISTSMLWAGARWSGRRGSVEKRVYGRDRAVIVSRIASHFRRTGLVFGIVFGVTFLSTVLDVWVLPSSHPYSVPLATQAGQPDRITLTRILFLYGSVPPGTGKEDMIRISNVGRNGYAQLVNMLHTEQGHNVYELQDTDPVVTPLTLLALKP